MSEEDFDWPNPWDWFADHGMVVEDHANSGFDLGVDDEGDVLIHFEGHVATVEPAKLAQIDGADNPEELIQND